MILNVTTIYHDSTGKQHTRQLDAPMFSDELNAANWDEVRRKRYLNGVIIDEDTNRVIQATGYTPSVGAFCDLYGGARFEPRKRAALDGRVWWCIYDNRRGGWSTLLCHGRYKTRREARQAIKRGEGAT